MRPLTYAEFDPITRIHFAVFVQRVFAELNPGTDYLDNFHIHVIIEALEDLRLDRNHRLAVAMPPRSLKSIIISVAWVAWLMGHNPGLRIICVSYGQELADKMASDCRQVIQSAWYRRLFPGTQLLHGRQSLANFETTAGGARFSTSVGGVLTGFGADYILLDDPMKPGDAISEVERNATNHWVQHTLLTRLNDKRNGRLLIVMQRLHEEDVIGSLLEKAAGTFKLLSFPAIATADEVHQFTTPFGRRTVFRREGEALHPDREPLEVLAEQRAMLGSRVFSAQYLQEPVPLEGNLVKRSWLRYYQPHEILAPDRKIQSWDTASKPGLLNDYSVGTTWYQIGERFYLVDVVRERLDFPALRNRVIDEADRHRVELVLIEDKGSGMGLLQDLSAAGFGKGRAVKVVTDKISRLAGISAMIEQGRVYLPQHADWLDDYRDELCGFPSVRHDDQVDSTSQALAWLRDEGNPGGLWFFMKQQAERLAAHGVERTVRMRAPPGVSHFYPRDGMCIPVEPDRSIWLSALDAGAAAHSGFVRIST